jgi:Fe-S-cluster containining protein
MGEWTRRRVAVFYLLPEPLIACVLSCSRCRGDDLLNSFRDCMLAQVCIKKCGACCHLGTDMAGLDYIKDEGEREQFKSMVGSDGWCVHFDKEERVCTVYEDRPRFCRSGPEVFEDLYKVPREEFVETAQEFCLDSIAEVYGDESQELDRYLRAIGESLPEAQGDVGAAGGGAPIDDDAP